MKKLVILGGIPLLLPVLALIVAIPAKAADYGYTPQVDFSWQGTPQCTNAGPKPPVLYQPNNPALPKAKEKGAIRLQWTKVPDASNYSVFYGLTPGNYIYSAADVGDTNTFTVRFLGNRKYYFAVNAKAGCAASGLSNEWWGTPNGGGYSLAPATGFAPVVEGTQTSVYTPSYVPANGSPSVPSVQGVSDQQQVTQPVYQPPVNDTGRTGQPAVTPVPAKPKGLFEWLLSLFGLGK